MERVAADPWARKRVMFDILNEPDAQVHACEFSFVLLECNAPKHTCT